MKILLTLLACLLAGPIAAGSCAAQTRYRPVGTCDGLPRLALQTPPGYCVGLLADGFKFPRAVLPFDNGDLLVADMGGWAENRGAIWKLTLHDGAYQRTRLLDRLDRPASLVLGPDGLVYVGTVGRVFRFDPARPEASVADVIGGQSKQAPLPGTGRHPLTQMVFDAAGNLFVNIGSASDNCESEGRAPDPTRPCPETQGPAPRGVIRKYTMRWPAGEVLGWENHAQGLRNSMALAVHPVSGELWQGENSRDAINLRDHALRDAELPHDEINRVVAHAHYGWPYCYDLDRPSPEYPQWSCKSYKPPEILLPPHAAPLGMTFYTGTRLPAALRHALIVGFHGYREHGHRLVAYPMGAAGRPAGRPVELIAGWDAQHGMPLGAPVDVKVGPDGAVYLTEDRNGTVLRLAYLGDSAQTR